MHSTDQLLLDLGQLAGLPQPLHFDPHGCARLMCNAHLGINFERNTDAGLIHIYSVLGPLPAEGREVLYQQLLEANLFCAETGGATLAIDSLTSEIILCRSVAADGMGAADFVQLVNQFTDTAEDWNARLTSPASLADLTDHPAPADEPMHGMGAFMRA